MQAASVLLVDDDPTFSRVMAAELGRLGFQVSTASSGEDAIRAARRPDIDVILLDLQLPGMDGLATLRALAADGCGAEVVMLTGHASIDTAIEAMRAGAFDYALKPCPLDELQVRIQRALERRALKQREKVLERGLVPPDLGGGFVGDSAPFRHLLHMIERVAASDSTTLITGETGSGKERVAKMIHARGARRARPFVVVECAALQESLLQSELFGHERGAFTGADRGKPGLFEVANGGTVFLDEIGEVSPATQVKLLRVLDSSTFRRVGGTAELHVDVRVIAATNRDVNAMVRQGLFREDLYYRLTTIQIEVPPLRTRGLDVDMLAEHFVSVFNERFGSSRRVSEEAMQVLRRHSWPGNVRELMHAVEGAMVVCEGSEILPEHLPAAVRQAPARAVAATGPALPTLEEMEREQIRLAVEAAGGRRSAAAKMLGISERNLYRKLREYGMPC